MLRFSRLLAVLSAGLVASVSASAEEATPVADMIVKEGFTVERLYSVPGAEEGSWVNICFDNKGRMIASDQYGKLYRFALPKLGETGPIDPEPIDLPVGQAQGLLYAFDSLYVMVANKAYDGQGLYRLKDTDGDDQYDEVKLLRKMEGTGEHGPHAILLSPDKQSLTIVCGNRTTLTEVDKSYVPQVWDEDLILPRAYGRGFMKGTPAPGGWICKTDPEGKEWTLLSTGFRNQYDAAYNRDGDLFTYDADMEWDMNTPWYRPTRVCFVQSGSEFGWRNGSGKWPAYYPDSSPPVINIGPGSPTGVTFGYGAKFPFKYQSAFFICDWSYGKLYAVHLRPDGAGYTAEKEEFITGTPLPLTDIVINENDGAMYFTTGGRRVQSGLYRVTYTGDPQAKFKRHYVTAEERAAHGHRRALEVLHRNSKPEAVEKAWKYLGSDDRFLQTAARVAIEHRPLDEWRGKVLSETDPKTKIIGSIALARHVKQANLDSKRMQNRILDGLHAIDASKLDATWRTNLLRAYQLAFTRLGEPTDAQREATGDRLDALYPAKTPRENSELTQLLVYLQHKNAAEKGVKLLAEAPTQEEQIDLAKSLRHLTTGWTPELQETYFKWFNRAATYRGGASFGKFVEDIKQTAVSHLSDEEKEALKPILEFVPKDTTPQFTKTDRPLVKEYTVEGLMTALDGKLDSGRDYARGRKLFGEAACFACHRFDQQGGAVGPDLTQLAGRFSKQDLLTSIVEPSKEISDQYRAVQIVTEDGLQLNGRIVNLSGDTYRVNTDMLNPDKMVNVKVSEIELMQPSKTSMMPKGLLDRFTEDEIADLMAYLLSRGNPEHAMFASGAGDASEQASDAASE